MTTAPKHSVEPQADLTRPIIGIENRTAQEVFDMMVDRITRKFATPSPAKQVGGEREAVARIIAPERWAVLDGYLADTKRKYRGQDVGWPDDQFWDKPSLAKADAILAALSPQSTDLERMREAKAIAAAVVQSACETDPADPDHPDTILISCEDLESHVRMHVECADERANLARLSQGGSEK